MRAVNKKDIEGLRIEEITFTQDRCDLILKLSGGRTLSITPDINSTQVLRLEVTLSEVKEVTETKMVDEVLNPDNF